MEPTMSRRPQSNCFFPGWDTRPTATVEEEKKNEEAARKALRAAEAAEMASATYSARAEQGPADLAAARAAREAWADVHDAWDDVQAAEPKGLTGKVCSSQRYPTMWC